VAENGIGVGDASHRRLSVQSLFEGLRIADETLARLVPTGRSRITQRFIAGLGKSGYVEFRRDD
jgi:hypothetical protein